ncbi:M48 family metallopeptidase [Gallaecimonas sp. GXIMD1310]|uniref:M48 family metallopeptidase n=1 Tax=Gallaecimonas sp. GXIMD1310 TaxID=3131926 RepID=UPI0032543839
MDFYSQQDKARRKTTQLVVLFIAGLLTLSLVTTLLFQLGMNSQQQPGEPPLPLFSVVTYAWVSAGVGTAALLAAFFKYMSLRGGGRKVAEALGGRRVSPHTQDRDERRLLNVVEEMAIAAGVPVPPVYLLEHEAGINAFAAGFTINDAVIGVTRGAVEQFDRAELQAVIGHEFSHIFNGDMRLNLRLVAMLFGLLFVGELGRLLLYSGGGSRNKKDGNGLAMLGLGLVIMGYLGMLWARLMQAAINRQREYLADASSVQFTRHPGSLASALKKVGGHAYASTMTSEATQTYSHLFFGPALSAQFAGLFASHPPLAKRIRRLEPSWDGNYTRSTPHQGETVTDKAVSSKEYLVTAGLTMALALPHRLEQSSRDPHDARYLVYALLLEDDDTIRQKQLALLAEPERVMPLAEKLQELEPGQRLMLIEKAVPSLRQMSDSQYQVFRDTLVQLAHADVNISLFEWILYQLVSHQVGHQYSERVEPKVRYRKLSSIASQAELLLSVLAWQASDDEQAVRRAFGAGSNAMGLYQGQLQPMPKATVLGPALKAMQEASEAVRQRFLRGAVKAVMQDGQISPEEAEFFRVLAVCLDSPVILPAADADNQS